MRLLRTSTVAIVLGVLVAAPAAAEPLRDGYPAALTGLIYKDPASKVIFYVETDGRHVVAISEDGKILWRKNPFVDAGLDPYRLARPTIECIGSKCQGLSGNDKSVVVWFTSSQFGVIDIATGKFTPMGQN